MGRVEGKTVIVTGAASGMGEGHARLFAQEGAKVVMTDINEQKLMEVYEAFKSEGLDVTPVVQDVSVPEQWDEVVAKTLDIYKDIDILINNAGIGPGTAYLRNLHKPEQWEIWKRVTEVQLYGPVLGMSRVLPYMVTQKKGCVLNVSSLSAFTGMGGATAYTAAKGGIAALTRAAASDNGKHNIRINAIVPGIVLTNLMEEMKDREGWWMKQELRRIKLNDYGYPIDTAYAALYLCSDEARHVTGVLLPVDGGYLTGYAMKD